ncbi:hypothetical protein ACLOJK_003140 [Asimina triloba]
MESKVLAMQLVYGKLFISLSSKDSQTRNMKVKPHEDSRRESVVGPQPAAKAHKMQPSLDSNGRINLKFEQVTGKREGDTGKSVEHSFPPKHPPPQPCQKELVLSFLVLGS